MSDVVHSDGTDDGGFVHMSQSLLYQTLPMAATLGRSLIQKRILID